MPVPVYTTQDFAAQFQSLLPTGEVWPRDPDAVQSQVMAALSPTYTRSAARAANLLVDAFPSTTLELLPEWELSVGLPDPCAGASPTIQQRRAQVVARLTSRGGQSIPYFTQFAASLGYPITITQFSPSRFGRPFGLPFGGTDWAFAWQINGPTVTTASFRFGSDAFGEPFAISGNAVLQCELARVAPAHTILLFSYGFAGLDSFVLDVNLLG